MQKYLMQEEREKDSWEREGGEREGEIFIVISESSMPSMLY